MAACSWHPDRGTALTCTRCGRPACPECLTPASVGFHCRACVAEARGTATQRAPRTVAGARLGQKPIVTMVLIGINLAFFLVTALQARSAHEPGTVVAVPAGQPDPGRGRLRRLLAAADRRIPARQPDPHRDQHGVAVCAGHAAGADPGSRPLPADLPAEPARLVGQRVAVQRPVRADDRGIGRHLRPDGRAAGDVQAARLRPASTADRRGHQRVHHLPVPRDLLAGPPGRAGGRRHRRGGHGLPAAEHPAGNGSGAPRSGWWSS